MMLSSNSLSLSFLFVALAAAGDPGCQNPGPGRCAGIVYAGTYMAGIGGVSSTTATADVVDGNCNSVVTSGALEPQGTAKGFKGEFQLTFGTLSRIYADYVSSTCALSSDLAYWLTF